MDKQQDPVLFCLPEIPFSFKDTHRFKAKNRKKISMQMKTKGEQDGYTCIRQNRL